MATSEGRFVLGLDLDGVCADFYGRMRELVAEWRGVSMDTLPLDVKYGLQAWGIIDRDEYKQLHRFAVTQHDLFLTMDPIEGAAQAIRRLGTEGVRVRIITHRLFIAYFHQTAVAQTVKWLDKHSIPYWDLCFMRDKELVDAHVYVEDTEANIRDLETCGREVIAFTNSTNVDMEPEPKLRADTWEEVEDLIRERYYHWREQRSLPLPPRPGVAALDSNDSRPPD